MPYRGGTIFSIHSPIPTVGASLRDNTRKTVQHTFAHTYCRRLSLRDNTSKTVYRDGTSAALPTSCTVLEIVLSRKLLIACAIFGRSSSWEQQRLRNVSCAVAIMLGESAIRKHFTISFKVIAPTIRSSRHKITASKLTK